MDITYQLTSSDVKSWVGGIRDEIGFWEKWFDERGGKWPQDYEFRTSPAPAFTLSEALEYRSGGRLRLLDAGSGLISSVGIAHPVPIELCACDPLAPFYSKILEKRKLNPYVRTEFAFVEDLTTRYSENSFDVAHVRNALDHSFSPMSGILSLLTVVRPRGAVILNHFENEAENGYTGFHQWNFTERDGRFVIWNRTHEIDVAKVLGDCASVAVKRVPANPQDGIKVVIEKHAQPRFVNTFKNVLDMEFLSLLAASRHSL